MKHFYLFCLLLLLVPLKSLGQTFASTVTATTYQVNNAFGIWGTPFVSGSFASITNATNTTDANTSNFAVMTATSTNLLVGGSRGYSVLRFNFASTIAAGKTAYIRIDQPTGSGLSVSLLSLIGDLTNLISKNIVYGKAYPSVSSSTAISNTTNSLVKDVNGGLYLAITSPSTFQSVEIYLDYSTQLLDLSLGATLSMNIYSAAVDYPNDNCSAAAATDLGTVTGLSVGLTAAVTNPEYALRNDGTSHSTLGAALGSIVGVGNSISQSFYFPQTITDGRQVKLDIQLPASLLNVTLLQNITVQAYNGTTAVGTAIPLSSVIRLDLLGLFSNIGMHAVYLTPTGAFDKITISLNSGINVNLGNGVYIYGIHSVPPKPTLSLQTANVYSGLPLAVGLSVNNAGASTITWFANDQSILGTGAVYNSMTPFTQSDTIYAIAVDAGCTIPSDSAKFFVNVLTATPPSTPLTVIPNRTTPVVLSLTTGGNYSVGQLINPPTFQYSNSTLDPTSGLTISNDGTITGEPLVNTTYQFTVDVFDQSNSLTVGTKTFSIIVPYALPVKYVQELTATYSNRSVLLDWKTANEINNNYFDVQRSTDAINWQSLTKVKSVYSTGNGNGSSYKYVDNSVLTGLYYYRLIQYDLDGKSSIGNIVSLDISGTSNALLAYPNPVVSTFRISNAVVGSNYRISSISGQILKSGIISNSNQEINISEFTSGLYFIEIMLNGKTLGKLKLLKK